ncbi:MAG: RHS repeat-associated core domain-containing protein, partial [Chloroflexota bacterium]|nr:RHS repeat-associated core domain-containing protein [Chloroflexota bacterium]
DNLYLVGHDTLGRWDGATWAYHLPDALGSVRQVADGAGAVASSREWTPYGVELGGAQAGLGYTGEWWDADVGLLYLRARWYDGTTGRFTQKDNHEGNKRQPQSLHLYAYVRNAAPNRTDPTGHFWYDPINDRWVMNGIPYPEAPVHPRIEFQEDADSYKTREDAFAWIMPQSRQIESYASQHGVPAELVAGILAVEIDDDIDEWDYVLDGIAEFCYYALMNGLVHGGSLQCFCNAYTEDLYADVGIGVGIGQVHTNRPEYDWWAAVQHYREQGYALPTWGTYPNPTLLTDEGAIEGVSIFGRALADLRTGVNASHTRDLSINDMGLIFVAYRFGIAGFNEVPGSSAAKFPSVEAFQKPTLDASTFPNGQFAMPYFEAFQFYFAHVNLYEAAYPEWRSR